MSKRIKNIRALVRGLLAGLKRNHYYHNFKHTIETLDAITVIGRGEKVTDEELEMLQAAALFHDTGFVKQYPNNEPKGANLARTYLPMFGFTLQQIEIIAGIIMATVMPQRPKTKLQKIMCDADLDNIGREDYFTKGELLRKEWSIYNVPFHEANNMDSDLGWQKFSLDFLEEHEFWTQTQKNRRNKLKQAHILILKHSIEKIERAAA